MKGLLHIAGLAFAAAAVLLALAVWLLPMPQGDAVRPAQVAAPPAAQKPPLVLDAITERPLFDRTRRPLEVAPEPVPEAPKPVVVIPSLHGVIGNADGGLTALLRMSNSPDLFARRVGEELGGYTIEQVESKSAIVRNAAGQTLTLILSTE